MLIKYEIEIQVKSEPQRVMAAKFFADSVLVTKQILEKKVPGVQMFIKKKFIKEKNKSL